MIKLVTKVDVFGKNVELNLNKRENNLKTFLGGFMTISMVVLVLAFFVKTVIDLRGGLRTIRSTYLENFDET